MLIPTPFGHTDTERDLDCLVDSMWPAISSSVMDEIKSLKISVNCKYSINIVCFDNNGGLIGAEKRLTIEKHLKGVHPSLMNGTGECLTIEWKDVLCRESPFTVSKRDYS